MDQIPRFNEDILCEIAYWANRQTCASLMLTCKALNKAAAKSILQQPYFTLPGPENMHKLLNFLNADPSRFHYVRELGIDGTIPSSSLDSFLDSLSRMTRLTTLRIYDGEIVLQKFPGLIDTIARLTTLRKLVVKNAAEATCELLSKSQAPLTSISMDWYLEDNDFLTSRFRDTPRSSEWPYHHPIPLLSKWSATLEELYCYSWFTCPSGLPKFPHVYPKLRQLLIDRDDNPLIASYICAYPNLANLHVNTDYDSLWGYGGDVDAIQQLHDRRAYNIRSQEGPGGCGSWPELRVFHGNVVDLYLLGITCRILQVRISSSVPHHDVDLLPPALAYARPQHLNVHGDATLLAHPSCGLTKLLHEPWAAHLESLVVRFDLHAHDFKGRDVASTLNDFATSLKLLPLRRLRLRVDASGLDPAYPTAGTSRGHYLARGHGRFPSRIPITSIEESLRCLDVEEYVQDLVRAIPSLEDVVVSVTGERDDSFELRTRTAEVVRVRRAEFADITMYEWAA